MSVAVTVVIPAYNAASYLAETLASVFSQTFTDFEVLIIDDGSTDNTAEIAHFYTQQEQRAQYFLQANQGVSASRNQGIELAKGELIAFLDADDQWLPNKLEAHVKHFDASPHLGISFARVEFMSSEGQPTGVLSRSKLRAIELKDLYYENLIVTPSNAVIRRAAFEQVGGFNQDRDLMGMEDAELFIRLICQGWNVEGIDQVLTRYRTAEAGVSSNLDRMERHWEKFSDEVKNYAPELVAQHYKRAKAFFLRYLARRSIRLGLPAKIGLDFMARSWQTDWRLILQEPRRTLLTWLAVYSRSLM
ncbi:MAG: glycosyltransferase family 2 protein [Cyanobacteria bacterium RM1_2_2]|nr:glycosyltransferase family 2 protein [Cyanobacteria bacterium RM1_2_2]